MLLKQAGYAVVDIFFFITGRDNNANEGNWSIAIRGDSFGQAFPNIQACFYNEQISCAQ
jgi:hypothetical protein